MAWYLFWYLTQAEVAEHSLSAHVFALGALTFGGDPVDIRSLVAHHPMGIGADVVVQW